MEVYYKFQILPSVNEMVELNRIDIRHPHQDLYYFVMLDDDRTVYYVAKDQDIADDAFIKYMILKGVDPPTISRKEFKEAPHRYKKISSGYGKLKWIDEKYEAPDRNRESLNLIL